MNKIKLISVLATLFAFFITTEGVLAGITIQLPGVTVKRKNKRYYNNRYYNNRYYKKRRLPSAYSSHGRWHASVRGGVDVASNDEGVMFSYDDRGEIILVVSVRGGSGKAEGALVPMEISFNGRHYDDYDGEQLKGDLVGISGPRVFRLMDRFKRSRSYRVYIAGTTVESHLRGSTRALKQIERAARDRRRYVLDRGSDGVNNSGLDFMMMRGGKSNATAGATPEQPPQPEQTPQKAPADSEEPQQNQPANDNPAPQEVKDTVQFTDPSMNSTGKMWADSKALENGEAVVQLNFVSSGQSLSNVSHRTQLKPQEAEAMAELLAKAQEWTEVAKKNKVGVFEKMLGLVSGTADGKNKIVVNFQSFKDGSTAAQIEQHVGGYPKTFNFDIESAEKLASQLLTVAKQKPPEDGGSDMSKEEKSKLFN